MPMRIRRGIPPGDSCSILKGSRHEEHLHSLRSRIELVGSGTRKVRSSRVPEAFGGKADREITDRAGSAVFFIREERCHGAEATNIQRAGSATGLRGRHQSRPTCGITRRRAALTHSPDQAAWSTACAA